MRIASGVSFFCNNVATRGHSAFDHGPRCDRSNSLWASLAAASSAAITVWLLPALAKPREVLEREEIIALLRQFRDAEQLEVSLADFGFDALRPHRLPEWHGGIVLRSDAL